MPYPVPTVSNGNILALSIPAVSGLTLKIAPGATRATRRRSVAGSKSISHCELVAAMPAIGPLPTSVATAAVAAAFAGGVMR